MHCPGLEEVKRAVDYLKAHSLNAIEDLDTAISNLNQTAAPLRRQLKQNENRMRQSPRSRTLLPSMPS